MSPSEGKQRNSLSPLDASRLHIQQRQDPRPVGWLEDPPVGVQTDGTDHMLMVRWTLDQGWGDPEIVPYANFSLPPTASCIHYATQCFEGMKVYRGFDGQLRLFRPDRNYERLRTSALRVSLPSFETKQLESLIAELLSVDAPKWLPADSCRGKSLYIRPALIGNGSQIGVRLPEEALLFVIVVPLHGISPKMLQNGLHLITSPADSTRAWPGGYGSSKIGGNYGPSFVSLGEAQSRGFDQVLWLFGDDGRITEAGASNFFVVWRTPGGALQLITAPLSDKLILPGVTRDSVLSLVRTRLSHTQAHKYSSEPLDAVEDHFTMNDVASAYREGRLVEAFVTGTAYFVTPVARIHHEGEDIQFPLPGDSSQSYNGKIRTWLSNIMYGVEEHQWAVVIPERSTRVVKNEARESSRMKAIWNLFLNSGRAGSCLMTHLSKT